MKAKLYGISVLLSSIVCFFQSDVSAQKNGQLLLKKKEAISSKGVSNDLNNASQAVLDEINAVRQNPQQFIIYLEEYRKQFSGSRVKEPDGKIMTTVEGVSAVDEAIAFLKNLKTVEPLQMMEGLIKAADLQLRDLSINPALGHTGADGSSFDERIKRFGTIKGKLGENIAFRQSSARGIVLTWIIDDGISSRLHRQNLFDSEFKNAGIAYGNESGGRGMCVLVLAAEFGAKGKPRAIEVF